MAARKAIWYDPATGRFRQITGSDTIDGTMESASSRIRAMTNGNAGSITIGQAVYISAAGTVDLARANAAGTSGFFGIVKDASVATTESGNVVSNGQIAATTGQWDAVTGGSGGLIAGSKYYLSKATAGNIVSDISAFTTGDFIVYVGRAISTTVMEVEPDNNPIEL